MITHPTAAALALVLVLGGGASVAAQGGTTLLLFPPSSSGTNSFFHEMEEPPCRQHRRLGPWREHVRARCGAEAAAMCGAGEREPMPVPMNMVPPLRRPVQAVPSVQMSPLFREMDAFFDSAFARPFNMLEGGEDSIEGMFNHMIEFSLKAFDQFDEMSSAAAAEAEGSNEEGEGREEVGEVQTAESGSEEVGEVQLATTEEDEEEGSEEVGEVQIVEAPPASSSDDRDDETMYASGDDYISADAELEGEEDQDQDDYTDADFEDMEAEALRARTDEHSSDADRRGAQDPTPPDSPEQAAELALDAAVASLARSMAAVASPVGGVRDEVPRRLSQFGQQLFDNVHRRRLSEGGDGVVVDPHVQVKERLARRLTEYEVVYRPSGVTVYTAGASFPSPFAMGPSSHGWGSGGPPPPLDLGMATSDADACLLSRYHNGDLGGGCGHAVAALLDAARDAGKVHLEPASVRERIVDVTPLRERFEASASPFSMAITFSLAVMFFVAAVLCLVGEEEEEVDDDEAADEFDYARLPEDEGAEEKVFVGVPVQVV